MSNSPIKVITRNSALALLQVEELFSLFPHIDHTVQKVASFGDKHKDISLMSTIDGDFFTRELDTAVLSGQADIAIHSAKDLPYPLTAGLEVYCLTKAADKSDSLVSRDGATLAQLPPGSRIGTSSAMRRAELLQIRSDIEVVSIRGTIEERIAQVDNGYIDALIVATCALMRLSLTDRIAQKLPFKTHPLQGNLAVVGRKGDNRLKSLFAQYDIRRSFGNVTLVGFGPGNPDLLTIAADKALSKADIIFHDDLLDQNFLSKYPAEKVYVGKRNGRHNHTRQDEINEQLYIAATAGKNVVRLKGGDPMILAHGREEIDFLQSRLVNVSVIPGVSAGIALASATHIPLTHRGTASSVAFVSGHGKSIQTPNADTLVYYMGGSNLTTIASSLIQSGRNSSTPAAVVTDVSLPGQHTIFTTLSQLQYSLLITQKPVIVIIGDVVALESNNTLQRTLYTGTQIPKANKGEIITHTPLIQISKAELSEAQQTLLNDLPFDWIVLTSRYGVRYFFEQCGTAIKERATDIRFATVGPVTSAELAKWGYTPQIESPSQSATGLLQAFKQHSITGKRILLPRSDKAIASLAEGLALAGNHVTDLAVYHNTPNPEAQQVDLNTFDKIVFSSPTGVEAFINLYKKLPEDILLVAKGLTTTTKLRENETLQTIQGYPGNPGPLRRRPPDSPE